MMNGFLVLLVVLTFSFVLGALDEKSCRKVPGWMRYLNNTPLDDEQGTLSDNEAKIQMKNFSGRTCCDFRGKCKVITVENKTGQRATCYFHVSCSGVDTGGMEIRRRKGEGWIRTKYCSNFFSSSEGGDMETCNVVGGCMKLSKGKDDLISCLNEGMKQQEYPGMFSSTMFPYREFSYTQRDANNQSTLWTLSEGGTIIKTSQQSIQ